MLKFLNKIFGIPEPKSEPVTPPQPEPASVTAEAPPAEIKPETVTSSTPSKPRGRKPAANPAAKKPATKNKKK